MRLQYISSYMWEYAWRMCIELTLITTAPINAWHWVGELRQWEFTWTQSRFTGNPFVCRRSHDNTKSIPCWYWVLNSALIRGCKHYRTVLPVLWYFSLACAITYPVIIELHRLFYTTILFLVIILCVYEKIKALCPYMHIIHKLQ